MDILIAFKVLGIAASCLLAAMMFASRRLVTRAKFVGSVASAALLAASIAALVALEARSVGYEPFLFLAWLVLGFFYYFGTRYVLREGIASKDEGPSQTSELDHPQLRKVLLVTKHLLFWPILVFAVYFVAKGIAGGGWVSTTRFG